VSSRETIIWAAQHRYPYIALNTSIEDSKKIWAVYDEAAEKGGYKGGPEQRGYLIRCHVQENEEKALANARQFMWMQGEFTGLQHPVWAAPSGYLGTWARRALAEVHVGRRPNPAAGAPFETQLQRMLIVVGTPEGIRRCRQRGLQKKRAPRPAGLPPRPDIRGQRRARSTRPGHWKHSRRLSASAANDRGREKCLLRLRDQQRRRDHYVARGIDRQSG